MAKSDDPKAGLFHTYERPKEHQITKMNAMTRNNKKRLICYSLVLLMFALPAHAFLRHWDPSPKKFAVVIGNGSYYEYEAGVNELGPLTLASNDATGMARILKAAGFTLVDHRGANQPLIDATKPQMDDAVDHLLKRIEQNPGAQVIFYYSGHGVYLDDKKRPHESANYILPVNQRYSANNPSMIKNSAVNAHAISERLEESQSSSRVIILDSCREVLELNESKGFGSDQSFIPMDVGAGTLVLYATRHASKAWIDPSDEYSVLTNELIQSLPKWSYRPINKSIHMTVAAVEQLSNTRPSYQRQYPWAEGGLDKDFCLEECVAIEPPKETGSLTVFTKPSGAFLYMNQKKLGNVDDNGWYWSTLTSGTYQLRAELANYQSVQQSVEIRAGKEKELVLTLPRMGNIDKQPVEWAREPIQLHENETKDSPKFAILPALGKGDEITKKNFRVAFQKRLERKGYHLLPIPTVDVLLDQGSASEDQGKDFPTNPEYIANLLDVEGVFYLNIDQESTADFDYYLLGATVELFSRSRNKSIWKKSEDESIRNEPINSINHMIATAITAVDWFLESKPTVLEKLINVITENPPIPKATPSGIEYIFPTLENDINEGKEKQTTETNPSYWLDEMDF